jgi:hypothetical protein
MHVFMYVYVSVSMHAHTHTHARTCSYSSAFKPSFVFPKTLNEFTSYTAQHL